MIVKESPDRQRIEQIKGLVKETFGKRVRCNRFDCGSLPLPQSLNGELGYLDNGGLKAAINSIYGNFLPGETLYRIIGKFEAEDGSRLRVLPEYEIQAQAYAEKYRQMFGSGADIILDPKATVTSSVYAFTYG